MRNEFELRSRYWSFDRFPRCGGITPENNEREIEICQTFKGTQDVWNIDSFKIVQA